MKKKTILLAATLAGFSSPLFAADMVTKAPAAPVVAYGDPFSGAYAGLHFGYGWNNGSGLATDGDFAQNFATNPQGPVVGLQGGYGALISPAVYLGLEGDVSFAALDGTMAMPGVLLEGKNRWLGSIRARVGWIPNAGASTPAMLYATGGWGWGSGDLSVSDLFSPAVFSTSATLDGPVVGGGFEVPIFPHWNGGIEYLHYFFNDLNLPINLVDVRASQNIDTVRGRISYRF